MNSFILKFILCCFIAHLGFSKITRRVNKLEGVDEGDCISSSCKTFEYGFEKMGNSDDEELLVETQQIYNIDKVLEKDGLGQLHSFKIIAKEGANIEFSKTGKIVLKNTKNMNVVEGFSIISKKDPSHDSEILKIDGIVKNVKINGVQICLPLIQAFVLDNVQIQDTTKGSCEPVGLIEVTEITGSTFKNNNVKIMHIENRKDVTFKNSKIINIKSMHSPIISAVNSTVHFGEVEITGINMKYEKASLVLLSNSEIQLLDSDFHDNHLEEGFFFQCDGKSNIVLDEYSYVRKNLNKEGTANLYCGDEKDKKCNVPKHSDHILCQETTPDTHQKSIWAVIITIFIIIFLVILGIGGVVASYFLYKFLKKRDNSVFESVGENSKDGYGSLV